MSKHAHVVNIMPAYSAMRIHASLQAERKIWYQYGKTDDR